MFTGIPEKRNRASRWPRRLYGTTLHLAGQCDSFGTIHQDEGCLSWSVKRPVVTEGRQRRRRLDPFGFALKELRRNAKKRGSEFLLNKADFLPLPSHCPVLGVKLDYSGAGVQMPRALTGLILERVISPATS